MNNRPLRQFYGHDRQFVLSGLAPAAEVFGRLSNRLLEALGALTEDEWSATTRCDAWTAKDVVQHLASAEGFWALTLQGRGQGEPTTFLRGFDPTTAPDTFIAPKRSEPFSQALEELELSTAQLAKVLRAIGDDELSLATESPLGHMPVSVITAHAIWDQWLHERDILIPLGSTPTVEDDELCTATAFSLFFGGVQGGLLDDADAVGDGPESPIDATVTFEDLPSKAMRVRIGRGVTVEVADAEAGALGVGRAVDFVEAVTGRAPVEAVLERLPADLAAQLDRARQVL